MKYRIISLQYRTQRFRSGSFKAKRAKALPRPLPPDLKTQKRADERININALFEYGELPSPPRKKRLRLLALSVCTAIGRLARKAGSALLRFFKVLLAPLQRIGKSRPRLAFYSGALTGALVVCIMSVATLLIALFGKYLLPYDSITVPLLVGEDISVADTQDAPYELLISYEYSESAPAGIITAQKPSGGVTRRIYDNASPPCISVTVSMGRRSYTVPSLAGLSLRDAMLELKNNGVAVDTQYEYSSDSPIGTVISTSPDKDVRIYGGDRVTLKVSLGKKITAVSVPDLYGLNEEAARTLLSARGLVLGSISYKSSAKEAGKIISQQYSPYSSVAKGTAVDVTVSLGSVVTEKTVPLLYGLTVSQAKEKLAEVGLVVGSVYSVSSGAPSGTVITQTPIAQTPITSALTSVDLYVSS